MKEAISRYEENCIKQCALLVVKMQKYKTEKVLEAIEKDSSINLKKSTAVNYINYGISYIKYGKRSVNLPDKFYAEVDELIKQHVQPLTPKPSDARRFCVRKYDKKETVLPIQRVPEVKEKMTTIFEYGVRIENRIILFDNEHSMATFIKNAKFVNPDTELQPVTVECENYER